MGKLVKGLLKIYSKFVRKTNNYILFESSNDFSDNAFALYEYIKKNYPQYKLKYLVIDKNMKQLGKYKNVPQKEMLNVKNKIKLYRYSLKSKAIFFTYINYWKKLKLSESTKLVYLTHGEFPLKDCTDFYNYLCGEQENKLILSTRTEFTKKILSERYPILKNCDLELFGMPRNDVMFHPLINKEQILKSLGLKDYKEQKVILSMTTFRKEHDEGVSYFDKEFPIHLTEKDLEELDNKLKANNQVLIIKLHPVQDRILQPTNLDNILFITNKLLSENKTTINEFYAICDSLLTDYSTSYLGFLNLDRPVGFILLDKESYSKNRGLTIPNIEDYMPGVKIYSKEDFFHYFDNLNKDTFKEEREKVRLLLTGNYGDKNCEIYAKRFLEK